jgi:hypothetical protein
MTEYEDDELKDSGSDALEMDVETSVLEVLETLLAAHTSAEERGIPIQISLTAEFIKEIINQLKNNITVFSESGEFICTIEEPLASEITNSAVKKYVEQAIINYVSGPQI